MSTDGSAPQIQNGDLVNGFSEIRRIVSLTLEERVAEAGFPAVEPVAGLRRSRAARALSRTGRFNAAPGQRAAGLQVRENILPRACSLASSSERLKALAQLSLDLRRDWGVLRVKGGRGVSGAVHHDQRTPCWRPAQAWRVRLEDSRPGGCGP